jgi:hypothetical protein
MLHLLSRMKKPALRHGRNHEKCTEERCNAFPADLHDYYSGHVSNGSDGEKCHCVDAVIKNEEVVVILEEDDCIPLLEIIPADSGDLNDLVVRIVKSTPEIPTSLYLMYQCSYQYSISGFGRIDIDIKY